MTDKKPTTARGSFNLPTVPLSPSEAKFIIVHTDTNLNRDLWYSAGCRSETLFRLDLEVKLEMTANRHDKYDCVIRRLRLKVGFTDQYLHRLGRNASSYRRRCEVVDISHTLSACTQYNTEPSRME